MELTTTQLIHLLGYATISTILATATWAGMLAILATLPIALITAYIGALHITRHIINRAKNDINTERTSTSTPPHSENSHE